MSGLVEIGPDDAIALADGELKQAPARYLSRIPGGTRVSDATLTPADLVPGFPGTDQLYLRIFTLTCRYLVGDRQYLAARAGPTLRCLREDLGQALLDIQAGAWHNAYGGAFLEPTVINGKIYVGSDGLLTVWSPSRQQKTPYSLWCLNVTPWVARQRKSARKCIPTG